MLLWSIRQNPNQTIILTKHTLSLSLGFSTNILGTLTSNSHTGAWLSSFEIVPAGDFKGVHVDRWYDELMTTASETRLKRRKCSEHFRVIFYMGVWYDTGLEYTHMKTHLGSMSLRGVWPTWSPPSWGIDRLWLAMVSTTYSYKHASCPSLRRTRIKHRDGA